MESTRVDQGAAGTTRAPAAGPAPDGRIPAAVEVLAEVDGEFSRLVLEELRSVLGAAAAVDVVAGTEPSPGATGLPVSHRHPELRVGPVLAPGGGPCPACVRRRLAQHRGEDEVAPPAGAVTGLPEQLAPVVAGLGAHLLGASDRRGWYRLDVRSLDLSLERLVPVGTCRRCYGAPGQPGVTGTEIGLAP